MVPGLTCVKRVAGAVFRADREAPTPPSFELHPFCCALRILAPTPTLPYVPPHPLPTAGALHSLATMEDLKLFTWGSNRCGQLGHPGRGMEWSPRVVAALLVKPTVTAPCPPADTTLRPHVPIIEVLSLACCRFLHM
jgi:hypothetical protein